MDAKPESLYSALQRAKHFRIPYFQRPYIWTNNQVNELCNDLTESFKEYYSDQRIEDNETYFLGPLVITKTKEERGATIAEIVDGQQRLTTIFSFLWVAHNLIDQSNLDNLDYNKKEIATLLTTFDGKDKLIVSQEDKPNFQSLRERRPIIDETLPPGEAIIKISEYLNDFFTKSGDIIF